MEDKGGVFLSSTIEGVGSPGFQSRLIRGSMGDGARLGEGSKSLLDTVLKSLGIICPLAFLCCRCFWKFYHGWQGRSARNSGGEPTGVSHGDVRNKISRGTITDRGSGGRFERTVIDDVSQGPPVHFVHKICRDRGGGSGVRAGGVFWSHVKIADSGGIKVTQQNVMTRRIELSDEIPRLSLEEGEGNRIKLQRLGAGN